MASVENRISLRIGGPAGTGIMQAGLLFAKCCSRIGLHVFDYIEYPSLIRGGHNSYQVRAEESPVRSQIRGVDILIALDESTLTLHAAELREESIIIYDEETIKPERTRLGRGTRCPMPLKAIIAAAGGTEIMQNTVALASALGILAYDFDVLADIIRDGFEEKKAAIVDKNIAAARRGYEEARRRYGHLDQYRLTRIPGPRRIVLTGNEAMALGAVKAGCTFYAAYPMTPASTILHTLASWQERHNIVVKHAEDEIGTVNMTIGAAYAGARAMCSTSGGGFALMQEGISLAGITETGIVVAEVMRGGPATGLPTWTEQSDLRFVLHAGHGDFFKIVLAPGDVEEAFRFTLDAFNHAEKYQTPVILLSDKYLGESHASVEPFTAKEYRVDRGKLLRKAPPGYLRYAETPDGISPRTIPGVPGGFFLANSNEHDAFGWSTEEPEARNLMMRKRMRKEETYRREVPRQRLHGAEEADLTIISWGSTKGPILDAMGWLAKDGYRVNFLQITHLKPFPSEDVTERLRAAKQILLVENNYTGQLGGVIREETGIAIAEKLLKYDGRPFYPEEIYDRVASLLGGRR